MWTECLGSVLWLDDLRAGWAFTQWPAAAAVKSLHLCLALCDPMDCSPPGSSVRGILQARVLEWVAISFSTQWPRGRETEGFPDTVSTVSPSISHEVMGPDAVIFVF